MTAITKTMKQDALDTARASINAIDIARTSGEADWYMGKAVGVLEFAQVWSMVESETVEAMRAEAQKAYVTRVRYLRGAK